MDPADATKTALFVGGSTGNDAITVRPADAAGGVTVSVNGANRGTFHPTGHVIVYGQAGNDVIRGVSRVVEGQTVFVGVPAVFHGGPGNDRLDLRGSTAANVLSGDGGRDVLLGGGGSDLLVGGRGADVLDGTGGEDILIGGISGFTGSPAALGAVLAEWGRADADYLTRTQHLSGSLPGGRNGSTALTPLSVGEDGAVDRLTGGAGLDWFFWGGGRFPDLTTDWSGGGGSDAGVRRVGSRTRAGPWLHSASLRPRWTLGRTATAPSECQQEARFLQGTGPLVVSQPRSAP